MLIKLRAWRVTILPKIVPRQSLGSHATVMTAFARQRPSDSFILQIARADSIGSIRHYLLGGKNRCFDEPADLKM